MSEEQPANHLVGGGNHRHRQISAHGKMSARHPMVGRHLAVAGIFADVTKPDDAFPGKGGMEYRGIAGNAKLFKSFPGSTRKGVQNEGYAALVYHDVKA